MTLEFQTEGSVMSLFPRSRIPQIRVMALIATGWMIAAFSGVAASDHPHKAPLFFTSEEEVRHAEAHPECTCRAKGESHPLGAMVCLGGNQLFRCAMDLNVTSWKPVGSPCPLS